MKTRFTTFLFAISLIICVGLSMASKNGRAAVANWGNTGAPGDQMQTCVTCHGTGSDIQVLVNLDVLDGNNNPVGSEYQPGTTYTLKVTVDPQVGSPDAYGFQLLALNAALDQAGSEVSTYANLSNNTQLSFASNTGRSYIEHDGPSATNEFTAEWTAPTEGAGPITFYTCGNGVNLNNSTTGDGAGCVKVQFNEGTVSSLSSVSTINNFKSYPNPVSDKMILEIESSEFQNAQWILTSTSGQKMDWRKTELKSGNNQLEIDMNNYNPGIYFMQMNTAKGTFTQKVIKL